jgi:high-affinity Fe2+/Pb2+ permease
MDVATVLKLAVWGICVAIALQVIFYFVFQVIGYNSYLLSVTLIVSLIAAILLLIGWRTLIRAVK